MKTLMSMLLHIPNTINLLQINEIRCREDLCLEDENIKSIPSGEESEVKNQ